MKHINSRTLPFVVGVSIVALSVIFAVIAIILAVRADKAPVGTESSTQIASSEEPGSAEPPSDKPTDTKDNPDDGKKTSSDDKDNEGDNKMATGNAKIKDYSDTPFAKHGKLTVDGNVIKDANGDVFQLCGISTHGVGWFPNFITKDSFTNLRDDFGANIVRLAMYTAEDAGYCTGGDKALIKSKVEEGIEAATDLGMYVIVDWHILQEQTPLAYKDEALKFFEDISSKYGSNDNVIYEICNEPNGSATWDDIKKYANEVIPVIRANAPDAIIIVGTPTWSQEIDKPTADPIKGYDNLMYAVHFYADTHKADLRQRVADAYAAGTPVFISEFGICDASGNGANNLEEGNAWISFLDERHISFVSWNLSNKNESSAFILPGCTKTSNWAYDDLSQSGQWLVSVLNTHTEHGAGFLDGNNKPLDIKSGSENGKVAAGDSSSNGGNSAQVKEIAKTTGGDSFVVYLNETNSWDEGGSKCIQYSLIITNNGSAKASGWTVEADFGQDVSVKDSWCSKISANGSKITVTPESYNSSIDAGKSYTDIGFIVKTSGKPSNVTVSVK